MFDVAKIPIDKGLIVSTGFFHSIRDFQANLLDTSTFRRLGDRGDGSIADCHEELSAQRVPSMAGKPIFYPPSGCTVDECHEAAYSTDTGWERYKRKPHATARRDETKQWSLHGIFKGYGVQAVSRSASPL